MLGDIFTVPGDWDVEIFLQWGGGHYSAHHSYSVAATSTSTGYKVMKDTISPSSDLYGMCEWCVSVHM